MFKLSLSEKLFEKIVSFYKSATATAAATMRNKKQLKIVLVYVVRSVGFNFQQNRTISTILMEKSAETAICGVLAAFWRLLVFQ